MGEIGDILIGFHEFEPLPSGPVPRYRWDSVMEVFMASDAEYIYRRFESKKELNKEYDLAKRAEKRYECVSVHKFLDMVVLKKI